MDKIDVVTPRLHARKHVNRGCACLEANGIERELAPVDHESGPVGHYLIEVYVSAPQAQSQPICRMRLVNWCVFAVRDTQATHSIGFTNEGMRSGHPYRSTH